MRLAAVYNVWDGEELLIHSMNSINSAVDVIVIIWQKTSNYGETNKSIEYFCKCLNGGKITVSEYIPDIKILPYFNERNKREQGLHVAIAEECTHFFFVDCDEFYFADEIERAKAHIEHHNIDSTVCLLNTFYRHPTWQLVPIEGYFVPFIHKISPIFNVGIQDYPVPVDHTRSYYPHESFHEFRSEDIMMYHYSFCRNDIGRKLRNSTAIKDFGVIEESINLWNRTSIDSRDEDLIRYTGFTLKETPDYFNLTKLFSTK